MLSGGGTTCFITDDTGADFTVDVDADGVDKVVVQSGADIGTLTVLGGTGDVRVVIADGAIAENVSIQGLNSAGVNAAESLVVYGEVTDSVVFDGAGGDDVYGSFANSFVGDLAFFGGGGDDRITILGDTDFFGPAAGIDLGEGNNGAVITGGAFVGGTLQITAGGLGNDAVALRGGSTFDDVTVDFVDGSNRFDFVGDAVALSLTVTGGEAADLIAFNDSEIIGDLLLSTGSGDDRVAFQSDMGGAVIGLNQTINTGDGDDRVTFEEVSVGGSQTIDLGTSTNRDAVRFGVDTIDGSSTVTFDGTAIITENGQRTVGGNVSIVDAFESSLFLRLDGGSDIAGNLDISANEASVITVNASIGFGGVFIALDGSNDDIINLTNLSVGSGGDLEVIAGGGNDELYLDGVVAGGFLFADMGSGDDFVDNDDLTLEDDAEFDGGVGFDTITDPSVGSQSGFEA